MTSATWTMTLTSCWLIKLSIRSGQLFFDIFDFDGFLGDVMTVNLTYLRISKWNAASIASAS